MAAQPDIQALNAGLQQLEGGLQATRQQLCLFGNIPAIEGGRDILHAIAHLNTTVNNGLNGVRNQLTGIENRLTGVENRLTGVEDRLTGVENRLTGVEKRLTTVETQITVAFVAISVT
jgi:predicted  nucleic acid-binding Zn-ribbon protein